MKRGVQRNGRKSSLPAPARYSSDLESSGRRVHGRPTRARTQGMRNAILAAAMSSSLSAIASTVVADLFRPREERRAMSLSRIVIVLAGVAQIAVGIALQYTTRSALGTALAVASLINGPILGVFFLGATKRANTVSALAGMTAGILAVGAVSFATKVAWPWYAVVGSLVTFAVGMAVATFRPTVPES